MTTKFAFPITLLIVLAFTIGCHVASVSTKEREIVRKDTTYADKFSFVNFVPIGERESDAGKPSALRLIHEGNQIVEIQQTIVDRVESLFQFQYTNGIPRRYSVIGTNKEQAALYFIYKVDTVFEMMVEFIAKGNKPIDEYSIDYRFPFPPNSKYSARIRTATMYLSDKIISQSYGREDCIFRIGMLDNPAKAFHCNWDSKSTIELRNMATGPNLMYFRNETILAGLPQLETGKYCFEFDSVQSALIEVPATLMNRIKVPCPE